MTRADKVAAAVTMLNHPDRTLQLQGAQDLVELLNEAWAEEARLLAAIKTAKTEIFQYRYNSAHTVLENALKL